MWISGPAAKPLIDKSDAEIQATALQSLGEMFPDIGAQQIHAMLVTARVFNWSKDEFASGGYSFPTPLTPAALEELQKPIGGRVYFAGEAVHAFGDRASVEAALASGQEVATRILRN